MMDGPMFSRCVRNNAVYRNLSFYELRYTRIRFSAGNEGFRAMDVAFYDLNVAKAKGSVPYST